jgi:predicted nucleic acid-binding Zn ribbon protein
MAKEKTRRPGVHCPVCGTANDLGRPFCKNCGARMYAGGGVLPTIEKKRNSRAAAVRAGVISFVCVTLAVVVGLVGWPFAMSGDVGSVPEARQTQQALVQMERDFAAKSPWRGYAVSESGWNAYAEMNIPEPRGMRISVEAEEVVAVAHTPVLGIPVSTRIKLVLSEEKGYFVPYSVWVGHFPLPRGMALRVAKRKAAALGLEVEAVYWDRVRIERVERGNLILTVRGGEGG